MAQRALFYGLLVFLKFSCGRGGRMKFKKAGCLGGEGYVQVETSRLQDTMYFFYILWPVFFIQIFEKPKVACSVEVLIYQGNIERVSFQEAYFTFQFPVFDGFVRFSDYGIF